MSEHLLDVLGMLPARRSMVAQGVPEVMEAYRGDALVRYGEGVHTMHINKACRYVLFTYNRVVVLKSLLKMEVSMSIKKRLKRLWVSLTTEEVFDEHGSLGRRSVVRRAPRG